MSANLVCSKCGAEVLQGFKFCGQCGTPLSTEPTQLLPGKPVSGEPAEKEQELEKAERRVVTVLFGDICGFTPMAEKMDPEDVRTKMNSLFQKLTSVITELGGTVDKYVGDCIMALFGAPESHEDDPERAVRAALKMQSVMADSGLLMRIGLNSGLCIAGKFGSDIKSEYTVIGDTVNVASRLETSAKPGSVLVSDSVHSATNYLFHFNSLPPIKLKGKKEPVLVYEVLCLREKPLSKRGLAYLAKKTPLIGRTRELTFLRNCFNEVSQGNPKIITVSGDAGIGKSRLLREFLLSLMPDANSKIMPTPICLESSGVEYLKNNEYRIILNMLAQYCNILENTPKEQIHDKLKNLFSALSIQDIFPYINYLFSIKRGEETQESERTLAHLPAVAGLDPASLRQELFQSFRKFFLALSQNNPLILIFEDAHWADNFSLDFARDFAVSLCRSESLTRSDHKILFIFTVRANEEKDFLKIFSKLSEDPDLFKSLPIKPLDVSEMNSLVNSVLGSVGAIHELPATILQTAEGNPFYLEEIIKSLIDNKVLVPARQSFGGEAKPKARTDGVEKENNWELSREVTKFDIPTGLHGLIMTRIDSLSKSEKELFKICSVIGENISQKILQKVAKDYMGMSPDKVSANLTSLEKVGIIAQTSPSYRDSAEGGATQSTLPAVASQETIYSPTHSLFKEVAYESLLKETRKDLHESVALSMESFYETNISSYLEILAFHFSRSDNFKKAVQYLALSGKKNEKVLFAGAVAFEYYSSAIEFFQKLPPDAQDQALLINLYSDRGSTSFRLLLGEYDKAISDFTAALDLARQNTLTSAEIQNLSQLGSVHRSIGDYDTALEYFEKAMTLAKVSQTQKREIPTLWNKIGTIYSDRGDHKNALKCYNISLELSEGLRENREDLSRVLNNLAVEYDSTGEFDKALQFYERCLKIEEEIHDKRGIAGSYGNIGLVYKNLGDFNKALVYLDKALTASQEISDHQGMALAFSNLGDTHYKTGNWQKALSYQQKALAIEEDIGFKWGIANSLDSIGMIYQKLEQYDKALEHHEKALNIAKEIESKVLEANATINLGYVKFKQSLLQPSKPSQPSTLSIPSQQSLDLLSSGLQLAYETGEKEIIEYGEKLKKEIT